MLCWLIVYFCRSYKLSDGALRYANLALEQNNQLFDWNAFYEEHQAAIDDPDNYDKIVTPMQ